MNKKYRDFEMTGEYFVRLQEIENLSTSKMFGRLVILMQDRNFVSFTSKDMISICTSPNTYSKALNELLSKDFIRKTNRGRINYMINPNIVCANSRDEIPELLKIYYSLKHRNDK